MSATDRPVTTGRCGRPTLDGRPCTRRLQWYETACHLHATTDEADDALGRLRAAQWNASATPNRTDDP